MEEQSQQYAAKRNTKDKIGFFGAMLGLAVSPWETSQALLLDGKPKFTLRFLFFLFIVIFGPAIVYIAKYNEEMYNPLRVYQNLIAFFVFLVLYVLAMGTYFFVLGIEFNFRQLLAICVYSLTPFISLMLIIYAFHYLGSGNYAFLLSVAQGNFTLPQAYLKIIPYLIMLTEASIFFIIAFSLRTLAEAEFISSLIYGVLAILPVGFSSFSAAFISELFMPGTKQLVFGVINALVSVWGL